MASITNSSLIQFLKKRQLLGGIVLFLAFYVLTRLGYYLYINIPHVFDDTGKYLTLADQIVNGTPTFEHYLPGYPLFLAFFRLFGSGVNTIIYFQSILTILCSIGFIYMVNKSYPKITFLSAFAVTINAISIEFLHSETAVLTESLYINLLVLYIGTFMLLAKTRAFKYFLINTLLMMVIIYVKGQGLFLVPLWMGIIVYMFIKKYPIKQPLTLIGIVFISFMFVFVYNYIMLDDFTLTKQGKRDLVGNCMTFIEPDPSYPAYYNEVIQEKAIAKRNSQEIAFIENSWDVKRVDQLYVKYQNHYYDFFRALKAKQPKDGDPWQYLEDCNIIAKDAIKKHPAKFLKFYVINCLHYFNTLNHKKTATYPYFKSYKTCFQSVRVYNYYQKQDVVKERKVHLFEAFPLDGNEAQKRIDEFDTKGLHKFSESFFATYNVLFRNYFWLALFFLTFILAAIRLIKSRFKEEVALVVTIICLMQFLQMALIPLGNVSVIRYNFTLHVIYYLSPALLWLMFSDKLNSLLEKTTDPPQKKPNSQSKKKQSGRRTNTKRRKAGKKRGSKR